MLKSIRSHLHKCVSTGMDIITGSRAAFHLSGYLTQQESVSLSESKPPVRQGVAWIRSSLRTLSCSKDPTLGIRGAKNVPTLIPHLKSKSALPTSLFSQEMLMFIWHG